LATLDPDTIEFQQAKAVVKALKAGCQLYTTPEEAIANTPSKKYPTLKERAAND